MSHTIKVIAAGFALLALCVIGARVIGGPAQHSHIAQATLLFIALWFVAAAVNIWVGVAKAGYSVAEEAPIFLVVFVVPVVVAVITWSLYVRR